MNPIFISFPYIVGGLDRYFFHFWLCDSHWDCLIALIVFAFWPCCPLCSMDALFALSCRGIYGASLSHFFQGPSTSFYVLLLCMPEFILVWLVSPPWTHFCSPFSLLGSPKEMLPRPGACFASQRNLWHSRASFLRPLSTSGRIAYFHSWVTSLLSPPTLLGPLHACYLSLCFASIIICVITRA